jgi:hypothetical protein
VIRLSVILALVVLVVVLASGGIAAIQGSTKSPLPTIVIAKKTFEAAQGTDVVVGRVFCPSGYSAMGMGWDSWNGGWVVVLSNPFARSTPTISGPGYYIRDMRDGILGSARGWLVEARRAVPRPDSDNRIMVGVTCLKNSVVRG